MNAQVKSITTEQAPKAIGPYSQAIEYDNLIFCSGQVGVDPQTGTLLSGIDQQTNQALKNLKVVLEASGASIDSVLKTTIFLTNIQNFAIVNSIYETFFASHKPARSTVGVKELPKGGEIEIEAIAIKK